MYIYIYLERERVCVWSENMTTCSFTEHLYSRCKWPIVLFFYCRTCVRCAPPANHFSFQFTYLRKNCLFGRGKTPVTSKNSFHSKSHLEIHIFTARVKINIVMLVHIARIVFNWLVPYIFGGWNMKFNMSLLPLAQTHMRFTIFTLLVNFHITMANHNFEWVNPL